MTGPADPLDAEPDISVVGYADTVEHALVRAPALRPHVAVLDVRLPDGDGITVCRELRDRMPELAIPPAPPSPSSFIPATATPP